MPIGLLAGIAGAALSVAGLGDGAPGWELAMGRRLVFEGVFLCLSLGIGAFLLPLANRGEAAPDLGPGKQALGRRVCGGGALHPRGARPRGRWWVRDRAAAPRLRGARRARPLRRVEAPSRPGANRRLVWAAGWAIPIGLFAAAALPDQRVEALHVTFVGGFGLLAFAVGTHVGLGHSGEDAGQAGRPWPVLAFGALFMLAMALRVTALAVPNHYFGWLGTAAALWLLGATVWAVYLLPKLWRAPLAPEASPRCHAEKLTCSTR